MRNFEPMTAPPNDPLKYPDYFDTLNFSHGLLCSPKIDGIRGVVYDSWIRSRKLIVFPNLPIQEKFSEAEDLDGEVCEGCITDEDLCHRTGGYLRSHNRVGDMGFYVFDTIDPKYQRAPFEERLQVTKELVAKYDNPDIHFLEHTLCMDLKSFLEYEEEQLFLGFEGIMWRNPKGPYKYGKGTWNEGYIGKLKRFADCEGIIVGFEEKYHNNNEDVRSETGKAKRGYSIHGKVPAGTLGKFIVDVNGVICNVAPGAFKHAELQFIWNNQDTFLYKYLKLRHTPHGAKDTLRQARAVAFRDKWDM